MRSPATRSSRAASRARRRTAGCRGGYRAEGHPLWERFTNKTIDDQLWYYRALLEFLSSRHPGPLVEDLRRAPTALEDLAGNDASVAADGGLTR